MINLHHADAVPDWEKIPPESWNFWQRTAAATKGLVTPGNIASVLGLGLVLWGLIDIAAGNTRAGFVKIAAGRLMDLVDGAVAHATNTKSLLSEATDASVDKIELAVGLPVLIKQAILPVVAGVVIGVQNLVNIVAAVAAKHKGTELRPSLWGKVSTAVQWGAIVLYGASAAAGQGGRGVLAATLAVLGHVAVVIFIPMGLAATVGYVRDASGVRSAAKQRQSAGTVSRRR